MTRTHLNFVADSLAFVAFLLLASTGVLLRYLLPPGSGGLHGRGTGPGEAQQSVLTLWIWTRHDWGAIHFWIACVLLAVLAVHLFLHRKWVVCVVRGKSTDRSGWRLGLGAVGLGALVLLAAAPWLSPSVSQTRAQLGADTTNSALKASNLDDPTPFDMESAPADESERSERRSDQLRGSMSLQEVALLAGVSVDSLIEQLGLPANVSRDARVGPLLREQGKHLSDLRQVIDQVGGPNSEVRQDREAVR
jgi:Domain of unknown function (DUF4405)